MRAGERRVSHAHVRVPRADAVHHAVVDAVEADPRHLGLVRHAQAELLGEHAHHVHVGADVGPCMRNGRIARMGRPIKGGTLTWPDARDDKELKYTIAKMDKKVAP